MLTQSFHVASGILQESILRQVSRNIVPTDYVYSYSANKSIKLADSMAFISNFKKSKHSDKIPEGIDVIRKPTAFKVKMKSKSKDKYSRHSLDAAPSDISIATSAKIAKTIVNRFSKNSDTTSNGQQNKNSMSEHSIKKVGEKKKRNLFSCLQEMTDESSKFDELEEDKRQFYGDREIEFILRSKKKLISTDSLQVKSKNEKDKKVKQNAVKKANVCSTDYDGNIVQLVRCEPSKYTPHFYQMDITFPQNPLNRPNPKKNSIYDRFEGSLFKGVKHHELNICESYERFGEPFVAKMTELKQKEPASVNCEKTSLGPDKIPAKMSFSEFQKSKNSKGVPSSEKQNQPVASKSSFKLRKGSILKSIRSTHEDHSEHMILSRTSKYHQNVEITNWNALNFLLSEFNEPRKKVTINEEHL